MRRRLNSVTLALAALWLLTPGVAAAQSASEPQVVSVTFSEAVDRALARSPSLAAAAEEIARSEAVLTSTRAAWLPSLYANATLTHLDDARRLETRVVSAQDQFSANLLLTVPLLAPLRWSNSAQAKSDVETARRNVEDIRRALAVSVARTYIAIITQHRVAEIATRTLQTAQAHHDFALRRFQEHYGSRLDEVRAHEEAVNAQAQLESAQAQLAALQESLGGLLGGNEAVDATEEPPLTINDVTSFDDDALASRTDVRLASQLLLSSEQLVDRDWSLHAPTLVGTLSPFFQAPPTALIPRFGWQAQLALQMPLFEGNLRVGQAREHRTVVSRRKLELESRLVTARAEVRAARKDMALRQASLGHAKTAAALAEEAFGLADLAYKAGATTNLEVVDAERRSRDAATAAAAADDAFRRAQLDLLVALGRFPVKSSPQGR